MNVYVVTYEGLWLGGSAIVIAKSEDDALLLAEVHSDTVNFKNPDVKLIQETDIAGVVYNDNGNY